MRLVIGVTLSSLLLLSLSTIIVIINSSSFVDSLPSHQYAIVSPNAGVSTPSPTRRSLKSIQNEEQPEVVALLNGTICLKDPVSGKILWSFSSGDPIFSSYEAASLENPDGLPSSATQSSPAFFLDFGDDWQLYVRGVKIPIKVEEFIKITPHISEDGSVVLGSKETTVFLVDAKTGRLIRSYKSPDSSSALQNGEQGRSALRGEGDKKDSIASTSAYAGQVIYIMRTDYALETFGPNSDKVSQSMKVAIIEAAILCRDIESQTLISEHGSDTYMPSSCQPRRFLVQREDRPLSSLGPVRDDEKLSLPGADKSINDHHERKMLEGSAANTKLSSHATQDIEATETLDTNAVKVNFRDGGVLTVLFKWSTAFPAISFIGVVVIALFGFTIYHRARVIRDGNRLNKASTSKRKKSRRSGKVSGSSELTDKTISPDNSNQLALTEDGNRMLLDLNNLIGGGSNRSRIGKLFISNTEIAKGSNGTVVLEGVYEGRPVAVKRLVLAHHDVAFKEIQNLIASDRHPNIVRWYGVEYDKDFVYISLERCACSLDDLIHVYSDSKYDTILSKGLAYRAVNDNKLLLDLVKSILLGVNLWKEDGHPTSLLLTLMRDIVSGLVHLHELGIIHRDLKPQNVLIVKERSLCAKLSDMGISKRLLENKSSLGHRATGCGSSGWQAPEQLLHGRQTRAVDLFSLGCVLFYCMTGGRHPFGDHLERDVNIVKNKKDLSLVEPFPEAGDLISGLLSPDPEMRPKSWEVLKHPMFWDAEMRLSFLRDASDRVELEDRESDSPLFKALESTAPIALGVKWDEKMEPAFISNIGRYRRYKFESVRDLLRVLRNKLNHYRELPLEIQELVGSVPQGYDRYFTTRYPKLLIEVYKVVRASCKEEECFRKYFKREVP